MSLLPTRRVHLAVALLVLPLGRAAAHDGVAERLAALDALVREEPGSADPLLQRAELHRTRRDFRAAAADLERARRLRADARELALACARLHRDARLPDLAWADLREFVARDEAQADELELAAEALHALDRTAEALPLLERAQALTTIPDPDLWLRRARWTEGLDDDGAARAVALLDEGLGVVGPCVALELEALRLEEGLGRGDDALRRLRRLSVGAARQEVWLARRGDLLRSLGRRAEARAAYEDALARMRALPAHVRARATTLALERKLRADLAALLDESTSLTSPPSSH